jgi:hypothetical protein
MFSVSNNLATVAIMLDLRFRNERLDGFQMFLTDMLKQVKLADYDEVEMWVFRTALKEEAEAWYRSAARDLSFEQLVDKFRKRFIRSTQLKINIDKIS